MKKTIVALMALAGIAAAAVESGSYTLKMDNWTTNDATLYNYLNGVFNEGGTLTFDLVVNYTGNNCGAYQTLLHVGQYNTGFSIYANGGPNIIVSEKHNTDVKYELSDVIFETGDNTISVTLTGIAQGQAAVSFVKGDKTYAAGSTSNLSWSAMGWNTTNGEAHKYSVNYGAPGYSTLTPATVTKLVSGSATYQAAPEPATATLSLLALAGLAARRRRR